MTFLSKAITRGVGRQSLKLQEHSPKLLFGGGVVGMVGSTVLACRSTLRLELVLDEIKFDLDTAKNIREMHPEEYSETDRQHDTAIIYVRSGAKLAKLYAPSIALGAVSIGALTKSHNILQERNTALAAAYFALDKGFREYRSRVVEKFGEDQDREFRYSSEVVVEGQGNKKPKSRTRVNVDEGPSIYARFFDEYSEMWSKEPEYNRLFLSCQQNWANDMLRARGHLFLNDVYRVLGIPDSTAGSVVGWRLGSEGDSYVDFGIFTNDGSDRIRDFVNGREGSILLDFNVDGVIYDKIETNKEAISWQRQ